MTIESSLAYDDQAGQTRWFRLSVGDGPKFAVLGCCLSSSSRGIITAPQTPLPPPPGAHPAAPVPQQAQPQFKRPEEWDAEGAIYPKQYLTTGFSFDEKGRLTGFTAEGSAINDNVADNQIYELVHGHPEMTEAQVVAALKQAGIKYGPDDKEQFTKDLPLQKLQRFLGPLELVSVNFHPLDRTRSWLGPWPDWTVDVLATQQDGTKLRYHMIFDHLKGDLIGLFIVPTSPSKPAEGRK